MQMNDYSKVNVTSRDWPWIAQLQSGALNLVARFPEIACPYEAFNPTIESDRIDHKNAL